MSANYSERAFFDGDHCHHCAAREDFERLQMLNRRAGATRKAIVRQNAEHSHAMAVLGLA